MNELGQTNDPKALVPGDAAAIFENARVLRGRYDDVIAAGEALKRIDTGGWTGQAADSFHERHNTDVPRWFSAGDSLDNGASALEDYADCLVWAQGQAASAIDLWQQGETATQQAKEAHDRAVADAQAQTQSNAARGDPTVVQPPPFIDTGEPKRQAARDMLNPARQQLADLGGRTGEALRAEAQLAPQDSLKQSDADFFGGMWDTIKGAGESLVGLITDPVGTAEALWHNATHPVETFKDAVAWDDWANGQGDRALGKIVGGLLLGGGAGKLTKSLLRRRSHHDEHGDRTPASQTPPPRRVYEPVRNRVKLRAQTKRDVLERAPRFPDGNFRCQATGERIPAQRNPDGTLVRINPDTGKSDPNGMTVPEPGKFHYGHVPEHEWWRYKKEAEDGQYPRERVIEDQNDPSIYRIETPRANRSHQHEGPR